MPRFSLAVPCTVMAALCGWAAVVLPWRSWTGFAITTTIVGAVHAITAMLAVVGSARTGSAWRVQSVVALTWLGWLTWNLVTSATYIAELYGGLGRGVAVALALVWAIAAFFTLPLSLWGLASTGGIRNRRRSGGAAIAALVLFGAGVVWSGTAGAAKRTATARTLDAAAIAQAIEIAVPSPMPPRAKVSLAPAPASSCERAPADAAATVLASFVRDDATDLGPHSICVQDDSLAAAVERLAASLADDAVRGPIAIDVITATHELDHLAPVADGLLLRPGIDGVCEEGSCLAPWQLLARDAFTVVTPIPVVPDLRFGFEPGMVRKALGRRAVPGVDGLVRITTESFTIDDAGGLHRLHRLREPTPELDADTLATARRNAERYILAANGDDGRFEYKLDPFTGVVSHKGFSLARQAGTTLVVCEIAEDREQARVVATRAIEMLVSTARRHGPIAALAYPIDKQPKSIGLGDTALASIALLSCRDLVGPRFDEDIDRMTRFLLAMQRPDGGFYPRFDTKTERPLPGPDPLYAVGQAVFALTLLEDLAARGDSEIELPEHAVVREAVEHAMTYTAEDYWQTFARDFFWMEENWHCLAARAALGHHRHDGYEQFCLDYVQYKKRLILDVDDGVDADLVGGYGFGNVLLPHNTGSSGFGEAMSAAIAVARVRGVDTSDDERALVRALRFLLHHQWNEVNSFACDPSHPVVGALSENMGSPVIRIDFVQHALAAMGHGGRVLGLAP